MKLTERRKIPLSVMCLFLVFCRGLSAEDGSFATLYLNKTANSDSVYFAQSPPMKTPQSELSECLFRVAKQISIRKEVSVRYTVVSEKMSDGSISKREQVVLDYDQNNSYALIETLTVVKIVQNKKGTEILAKVNGKNNFKSPSVSIKTQLSSDGNPQWVSKPPKGSQFYAAVGSITQASNKANAFTNADATAIGSLTPFVATPSVSGVQSTYTAVLHGAYIARRWFNVSQNRYYSLAILPR